MYLQDADAKGSLSKLGLNKQDSKSSSSSSSSSSSNSSSKSSSEKSKKEAEKRPSEKVLSTIGSSADLVSRVVNVYRLKASLFFSPSATQVRVDLVDVDPPKKPRLEKQENRSSPITVQTSKDLLPNISDYDETNADDFAMEMGLACVVCRSAWVKYRRCFYVRVITFKPVYL